MRAERRGVVINMSSVAALVGLPQRAACCAAKGAVAALTRAMAVDHVAEGIRVDAPAPGTIATPWVERLVAAADDPVATRRAPVERQPMSRLGSPEAVAAAAVYLASDEAAFVTGAILTIDGASPHTDPVPRALDAGHADGRSSSGHVLSASSTAQPVGPEIPRGQGGPT